MAVFNPGSIHQLREISAEVVKQISSYAGLSDAERDEDDSGIVRQVRIIAASLNGALEMLNRFPPTGLRPPGM